MARWDNKIRLQQRIIPPPIWIVDQLSTREPDGLQFISGPGQSHHGVTSDHVRLDRKFNCVTSKPFADPPLSSLSSLFARDRHLVRVVTARNYWPMRPAIDPEDHLFPRRSECIERGTRKQRFEFFFGLDQRSPSRNLICFLFFSFVDEELNKIKSIRLILICRESIWITLYLNIILQCITYLI